MLFINQIIMPIRLVLTPVIGALVIGYFAYHSVKGEHGLNAYLSLSAELAKAEKVLLDRVRARELIELHTKLIDSNSIDLDALDERTRLVLNFIQKDERIILY